MSPRTLVLSALLVALAPQVARAEEPSQVEVFVGGKPRIAPGWSLDGAEAPTAPGDVLVVDEGWPIPRTTEVPPRFRGGFHGDGLYEESGVEGDARLVGVRLERPRQRRRGVAEDGEGESVHPEDAGIPRLTDTQAADVRSVIVEGWPPGAAEFLARLNPTTTCVWIRGGLEQALPALPARLRYLFVTGSMPADLSGLARLSELRFLVLRGQVPARVDARPLAGLSDLRVLVLPAGGVGHVDALAALRNLRQLRLSRDPGLTDLAWLRGCAALRRLDVSHTAVADLSPVGALPALEAIDAHLSPVRTLPAGPCASLRSLRLGSAVAAPEALAAFRRAHPACAIAPGLKDALLAGIEGVDRVRIRTGGTCHRQPEDEVVRDELTSPEAIGELLALLEVDDCGGLGGCMCCGTPTFEFLAGSRRLAAVSLHHGSRLRWDGGAWPGDVDLTDAAEVALAGWLARHGEPEPLEDLEASRRREAAERRREERQLALLGPERLAALREDLAAADSISSYAGVLRRFEPDAERRTLLALRLHGAAGTTWSEDVTYAAAYTLPAEAADLVVRVGRAAAADDEGRLGFALYLLPHTADRGLPDAVVDELVPPAARRLLADADPGIRVHAIEGLARVRRPFAIHLLRRVLAGDRLGPDGAWDAGGPSVRAGAGGVGETRANVAAAASSLVQLGDVESLPRIRDVAAGLHGDRRRRLLEQVEELAPSPKASVPR